MPTADDYSGFSTSYIYSFTRWLIMNSSASRFSVHPGPLLDLACFLYVVVAFPGYLMVRNTPLLDDLKPELAVALYLDRDPARDVDPSRNASGAYKIDGPRIYPVYGKKLTSVEIATISSNVLIEKEHFDKCDHTSGHDLPANMRGTATASFLNDTVTRLL